MGITSMLLGLSLLANVVLVWRLLTRPVRIVQHAMIMVAIPLEGQEEQTPPSTAEGGAGTH